MPKTEEDKKLDKLAKIIDYLYCRWEDEKKYEDFEDYKARWEKEIKEVNCEPIKRLSKSPFQGRVKVGAKKFLFRVNARGTKIYETEEK